MFEILGIDNNSRRNFFGKDGDINWIKNRLKKNLKNYKHFNLDITNYKDFNKKEMLHSLYVGLKKCKNDTLVSYSDIYFSKDIIRSIYKKAKNEIIIPVSKNWKKVWKIRKKNIFEDCETLKYDKRKNLTEIGNKIKSSKDVMGQYMGIIYIPKNKINLIKKLISKNQKNKKLHISQFLNKVIKKNIQVKCLPTQNYWYEFDDLSDLKNFSKKIL